MKAKRMINLLILLLVVISCSPYQKKEFLVKNARYQFYMINDRDIKDFEKIPDQMNSVSFPTFSSLQWKKYFSVLAYQKTSLDNRLISTIFTREQVREFLPLFIDAHVLIKKSQRLLVVANDFPYRSVNSLPSLTNFMIWSDQNKIHIIFGAINEILFEYARLSEPKFKINFKDLKLLQEGGQYRLIIASALRPEFQEKKISGITQRKWLTTEHGWFLKDHRIRVQPDASQESSTEEIEKIELEL